MELKGLVIILKGEENKNICYLNVFKVDIRFLVVC